MQKTLRKHWASLKIIMKLLRKLMFVSINKNETPFENEF